MTDLISVAEKTKITADALTALREYWKSILSVIVLGLFASTMDIGAFFTFLFCSSAAFLFSSFEKHYRVVFHEFLARFGIAACWALTLEYTEAGSQLTGTLLLK